MQQKTIKHQTATGTQKKLASGCFCFLYGFLFYRFLTIPNKLSNLEEQKVYILAVIKHIVFFSWTVYFVFFPNRVRWPSNLGHRFWRKFLSKYAWLGEGVALQLQSQLFNKVEQRKKNTILSIAKRHLNPSKTKSSDQRERPEQVEYKEGLEMKHPGCAPAASVWE